MEQPVRGLSAIMVYWQVPRMSSGGCWDNDYLDRRNYPLGYSLVEGVTHRELLFESDGLTIETTPCSL